MSEYQFGGISYTVTHLVEWKEYKKQTYRAKSVSSVKDHSRGEKNGKIAGKKSCIAPTDVEKGNPLRWKTNRKQYHQWTITRQVILTMYRLIFSEKLYRSILCTILSSQIYGQKYDCWSGIPRYDERDQSEELMAKESKVSAQPPTKKKRSTLSIILFTGIGWMLILSVIFWSKTILENAVLRSTVSSCVVPHGHITTHVDGE